MKKAEVGYKVVCKSPRGAPLNIACLRPECTWALLAEAVKTEDHRTLGQAWEKHARSPDCPLVT